MEDMSNTNEPEQQKDVQLPEMPRMSEEDVRRVKELFERGQSAFEHGNYEYAITLLSSALNVKPEFFVVRKLLHHVQRRKAEQSPPNVITKYVLPFVPFVKAKIYYTLNKDFAAIRECERALSYSPSSVVVWTALGLSAYRLGYFDAAVDAFERVIHLRGDHVPTLKILGKIFSDQGLYSRSQAVYERACQVASDDEEARRGLQSVAAMKTIQKVGWEDETSFYDKVKDVEAFELHEKDVRSVKSSQDLDHLIGEDEERLAANPQDLDCAKHLLGLYLQARRYERAEEMLKSTIELFPQEIFLKKYLQDVQAAQLDIQIKKVKKEYEEDKTNEALKEKVEGLVRQKQEFMLKESMKRVEENPNDPSAHFQLAKEYFGGDRIDEAIAEFQISVTDPRLRVSSLNWLGKSFYSKKMYDIAVGEYEKAASELMFMDTMKKDILYNLGLTYVEMGLSDKAIEAFKQIYAVDIHFYDVADRIHAFYEKRDKGKK